MNWPLYSRLLLALVAVASLWIGSLIIDAREYVILFGVVVTGAAFALLMLVRPYLTR